MLSQRSLSDTKAGFAPSGPPRSILSPHDRAAALSGRHYSTDALSRPHINQISPPSSYSPFTEARVLLDQQREIFEAERALFVKERLLWTSERQSLYSKIEELERTLDGSNARYTSHRSSSARASSPPFSIIQHHHHTMNHINHPPDSSSLGPGSRSSSVDESAREMEDGMEGHISPIEQRGYLASISESLEEPEGTGAEADGVISPQRIIIGESFYGSTAEISDKLPAAEDGHIDISKIDDHLDGITLKTSAIVPRASVSIPQTSSPPSALSQSRWDSFSMDQVATHPIIETILPPAAPAPALSPFDSNIPSPHAPNLSLHAGHTPMAAPRRSAAHAHGEQDTPDAEATPRPGGRYGDLLTAEPHHLEPSHSTDPLSTESIPPANPQHPSDPDPALTAPLGLTNEQTPDSAFLQELDMRLLSEAKRMLGQPPKQYASVSDEDALDFSSADEGADGAGRAKERERNRGGRGEGEEPAKRKEDPEIRLKFKRSMNFGSAFGSMRSSVVS